VLYNQTPKLFVGAHELFWISQQMAVLIRTVHVKSLSRFRACGLFVHSFGHLWWPLDLTAQCTCLIGPISLHKYKVIQCFWTCTMVLWHTPG